MNRLDDSILERSFIDKNKLVSFNYNKLKYCVLSEECTEWITKEKKMNMIQKRGLIKDLEYLKKLGFFSTLELGDSIVSNYDYISTTILVTNKCNLMCTHCLHGSFSNINFIDVNNYVAFLDKYRIMEINFSGGEFFQHPQYKELIDATTKRNIIYSIYTNGVDIPEQFFQLVNDKNLFDVQISVESHLQEVNDQVRGKNTYY